MSSSDPHIPDPNAPFDLRRSGPAPRSPTAGTAVPPAGVPPAPPPIPAPASSPPSSPTSLGEKATEVAEQAGEVVSEARDHATDVVDEAKAQAQDLFFEARRGLEQKAEQEVQQVASGLHGLGDELRTMAAYAPNTESLPAAVARQAADVVERVATQLDEGGLTTPTRELKRYARSHPGRFLGYAFVAGAMSGRLARNVAARGAGGTGGTGGDGAGVGRPTVTSGRST